MTRRLVLFLLCLAVAAPAAATAGRPLLHGSHFVMRAEGAHQHNGYFVYTAKPGALLHGLLRITNVGDKSGATPVYAADATTGSTTGVVYLTNTTPRGVGRWIHFGSTSVAPQPGRAVIVPFTIHVPKNVKPGQYVGGSVIDTSATTSVVKTMKVGKREAAATVQLKSITVIAYQVNVSGKMAPRFRVSRITGGNIAGTQVLYLHLSNDGNAMAKPTGTLTLSTLKGVRRQPVRFRMDTVLPHTAIDYPLALGELLPSGAYTAEVEIDGDGTKSVETLPVSISTKQIHNLVAAARTTKGLPAVAHANDLSGIVVAALIGAGALLLLLAGALVVLIARLRRR